MATHAEVMNDLKATLALWRHRGVQSSAVERAMTRGAQHIGMLLEEVEGLRAEIEELEREAQANAETIAELDAIVNAETFAAEGASFNG